MTRTVAPARTATLTVYVEESCTSCGPAREVAARVAREFPSVHVRIAYLGVVPSDSVPEGVFAAPTFVLNNEVVSLGTPGWEELTTLLRPHQPEGEPTPMTISRHLPDAAQPTQCMLES